MHSLPIFLDVRGRPVILIGEGEAAEAKRRLLERAGARVVGEAEDAKLAIVSVRDDAEAEAAVARLKAHGILVNVTDRPTLCDFTVPAIVDRDPVLVAVGTGGASAGLAKALRQRLEAMLPTTLGSLAARLAATKQKMRERWPDFEDRRRAINSALEEGAPLDPLSGRTDVEGWLAGEAPEQADALIPIRLRSPDPDELTLKQARLLGQADRIFHRPDVPPAILNRARADAARIACAAPPADPGPGLSLDLAMERQ